MAKNLVYRNTDSLNRVETLGATFQSGKAVLSLGGKPAVTVTASGDATRTDSTSFPPYTISGIPNGGVGLVGKQVTLAFDGTWEFANADVAGTTAATATQGQVIYISSSNALTTTASSNTRFGTVDFPPDYDKTRGFIPIKIGG
jgi:hypothetical protein